MKPRRKFFTAALATAALPCDADAEALAAQASTGGVAASATGGTLPTIAVGKFRVSRLMIGGNPLHGYSHFNSLYSKHMLEWADRERVRGSFRIMNGGWGTWRGIGRRVGRYSSFC